MESNPTEFKLLCYVLTQLDPNSYPKLGEEIQQTLLIQFPNLNHPKVLDSMTQIIPNDAVQTLSLLRTLGSRPDPVAVAVAREKMAEIQHKLQSTIEEEEEILKGAAEKELQIYEAVVRLEDMHEACGKHLKDVEEKLVEAYGSVIMEVFDDGVNEEVIGILKEAETRLVERIELSDRQLRFLPEAFGKLHGLVSLNLSHNQLENIPDSISRLKKLEELDVSSNLLVSLPDSIGLLLNLRVINVSGNKLRSLPECISLCSSLVEIDASFNNLMSLPVNIGYGLPNLERLLVHLNKIHFLPTSICELKSLSNFGDLRELPESIADLTNLRELDLSNNQIRALPNAFGQLQNLKKLNLDQNPLVIPPVDIANKGIEAVREFMSKRWFGTLAEDQQRSIHDETNKQEAQTGWLAWGSSLLSNFVSGVSQSVGNGKAPRDPWLEEEL
ncbi:plant intracellular Ras-group-related LRR protein 3-like isoform X2 [Ziziphus jujuba]|uniref:Plant intracellular Ras-group-related LRR protein 3-like isoform X2 n=1 Tax=Ziziphus jujuba TaxID=326968 RepID=A0ABM3I1R5_ZIZJJ|nr:plant intracellular Ras-group-related LRR protein 3-like isoform X2 [Ziziphus jujuba]